MTPGVTARPRATLITAIVLSLTLIAASFVGWFALPPDIRGLFTALQLGTLVFFIAFMVGFMLLIGLSVVRADDRGLRFRNGLRSHELSWEEIARIRYREGDPWAFAELVADHPSGKDRYQLLGIQQTDGARARALAQAVRAQRPAAISSAPPRGV